MRWLLELGHSEEQANQTSGTTPTFAEAADTLKIVFLLVVFAEGMLFALPPRLLLSSDTAVLWLQRVWRRLRYLVCSCCPGFHAKRYDDVDAVPAHPSLTDRAMSICNAFAGGLFLSSGFVHLLGESQEALTHADWALQAHPAALTLCALGFLATFFLEKVFFRDFDIHDHQEHHGHSGHDDSPSPAGSPTDGERHTLLADDRTHSSHSKPSYGAVETPSMKSGDFVPLEDGHQSSGSASSKSEDATTTAEIVDIGAPAPAGREHHPEHHHRIHHPPPPYVRYLLLVVLSIHSFISGVAVGISSTSVVPLVISIFSHKWAEAIAVGVALMKFDTSARQYWLLITIYALAESIGTLLGIILLASLTDPAASWLVQNIVGSIAAGTFIYVATIDILVEEFQEGIDKYYKMFFCLLGFVGMSALTFSLDSDEH
jgi:zinc transporter ZupT